MSWHNNTDAANGIKITSPSLFAFTLQLALYPKSGPQPIHYNHVMVDASTWAPVALNHLIS